MLENKDYVLCEDNWETIRDVETVGARLNSILKAFEVNGQPDPDILELVNDTAKHTGILLAKLVALQVQLLLNL